MGEGSEMGGEGGCGETDDLGGEGEGSGLGEDG